MTDRDALIVGHIETAYRMANRIADDRPWLADEARSMSHVVLVEAAGEFRGDSARRPGCKAEFSSFLWSWIKTGWRWESESYRESSGDPCELQWAEDDRGEGGHGPATDRTRRIRRALNAIPKRDAAYLRRYYGFESKAATETEIAREFKVPRTTLRKKLVKARESFRVAYLALDPGATG